MRTVALVEHNVHPGGREPAPGRLELVQAFVNTVDREHGPDLLGKQELWDRWLAHRGLSGEGVNRMTALNFREALRTLLWANNGGPADDGAVALVDRAAGRLEARVEPARFEAPDLLAEIAGVAFMAMADGTWKRLKACPGDRCGWAFYDRSRNSRATWCSMDVCGGRAKARAYYERRR